MGLDLFWGGDGIGGGWGSNPKQKIFLDGQKLSEGVENVPNLILCKYVKLTPFICQNMSGLYGTYLLALYCFCGHHSLYRIIMMTSLQCCFGQLRGSTVVRTRGPSLLHGAPFEEKTIQVEFDLEFEQNTALKRIAGNFCEFFQSFLHDQPYLIVKTPDCYFQECT